MTIYLLDANVFIQAKNLHYGFDFCPAFWDWLIRQNRAGKVASIEKVADELHAVDDDLKLWAKKRGADFFLRPDDAIPRTFKSVSDWVVNQNYSPTAIDIFLQGADYWLIAYALAHRFTVVTHEKPENSRNKIKIPNACIGLKIPCITPYAMLRREQARFVLPSRGKPA